MLLKLTIIEDSNLFKVAIVTDHVASLLDIDPLDYVRKVKASDDSHYSVHEEYKQLYELVSFYYISSSKPKFKEKL